MKHTKSSLFKTFNLGLVHKNVNYCGMWFYSGYDKYCMHFEKETIRYVSGLLWGRNKWPIQSFLFLVSAINTS